MMVWFCLQRKLTQGKLTQKKSFMQLVEMILGIPRADFADLFAFVA